MGTVGRHVEHGRLRAGRTSGSGRRPQGKPPSRRSLIIRPATHPTLSPSRRRPPGLSPGAEAGSAAASPRLGNAPPWQGAPLAYARPMGLQDRPSMRLPSPDGQVGPR
ncbi:hypothetical protein ISF6_1545 [Piscinibacter sakaiensis]|uniref:Uncharacterized protein n=1 Tax=Piscinibacter sakaiensis TaxID=1547922 RepID=A0A0K8NZE1_PISS1|nr:hypothetical protein ISF6_1545 [Piscinibacter sakaiensis]